MFRKKEPQDLMETLPYDEPLTLKLRALRVLLQLKTMQLP